MRFCGLVVELLNSISDKNNITSKIFVIEIKYLRYPQKKLALVFWPRIVTVCLVRFALGVSQIK